MGGKGQRRREKNYREAHGGGYTRLPPPPKPNEIDALPSKLRKIMDFTSNPSSFKLSTDLESKKRKRDDISGQKKLNPKESGSKTHKSKEGGKEEKEILSKHKDDNDEIIQKDTRDKKKAKRKKKQLNDLRFETTQGQGTYGVKKRERKKKYLEARKNKHKKAKIEEGPSFAGHEEIKFGEVVDAPPKLLAVPKAFKKVQDASHERLRLQAVEAYRNRKGWGSRPGVLLPPHITLNPSL